MEMSNSKSNDDLMISFLVSALTGTGNDAFENLGSIEHEIRELSLHCLPVGSPATMVSIKSEGKLFKWLRALANCAAFFRQHHLWFLDSILRIPWLCLGEDLANAFRQFIEGVSSAQPPFSSEILRHLVRSFNSPTKINNGNVCLKVYEERLHVAIQSLSEITPSGPEHLVPMLAAFFPNRRLPLIKLQSYIGNLLKVYDNLPLLRGPILLLIMENLVLIDLDVQTHLDDIEYSMEDPQFLLELTGSSKLNVVNNNNDLNNPLSSGCGSQKFNSDYNNNNNSEEEEEEGINLNQNQSQSSEDEDGFNELAVCASTEALAAKLDNLMLLILNFFSTISAKGLIIEATRYLLKAFDTVILRTYRARRVQFLLFYILSRGNDECVASSCDEFLGLLSYKVFGLGTPEPSLIRMSAAGYMSSFLARAKYVPIRQLRMSFDMMIRWCLAYTSSNECHVSYPDKNRFGVFYSVVQAVMYVFCFRWEQLCSLPEYEKYYDEGDDDNSEDYQNHSSSLGPKGGLEGFEQVINSRFNPLKVLCPDVVTKFAEITAKLDILLCYPIINMNKRLHIPSSQIKTISQQDNSKGFQSVDFNSNQQDLLEATRFFPFDYPGLSLSQKHFIDKYIIWKTSDNDEDCAPSCEEVLSKVGGGGGVISQNDYSDDEEMLLSYSDRF